MAGRGPATRPGAGSRAVDRRDHRLRHLAQVAHASARHPGELVDVARAHLQQLADDLVNVPAGAEPAAATADHEHSHVLVLAPPQRIGQVADVRVNLKGQGIESLGPREGEGRDAVSLLVVEVFPAFHRWRTATASISISASGSTSERTSISVDAG